MDKLIKFLKFLDIKKNKKLSFKMMLKIYNSTTSLYFELFNKGEVVVVDEATNFSTTIKMLPPNLIIEESLSFIDCQIMEIDKNTTINGDLELSWCPNFQIIKSNCIIKGDLYILDCPKLYDLPKDIKIDGSIFLSRKELEKTAKLKIPDHLKDKVKYI